MKEFAEAFYKSDRWQKCRGAYIAERLLIDGGLCEECRARVGYIVHHKKQLTEKNINDPSVRFAVPTFVTEFARPLTPFERLILLSRLR